jgi:cholesterol transport system auxiliary component
MSTLPRRSLLPILATLPFVMTGCGGLLSSPKPRHLYQLTPATVFPEGLPNVSAQLTIDPVDAPAGLDTDRIALSRAPLSLDYYADIAWSDQASAVVRNALIESFENCGHFTAVGSSAFSLNADYTLKTGLRSFEALYDSASKAPTVTIVLGVKLIKLPARTIVAQTVISERQRAAGNEIPQIVEAFNEGLHREIAQIVGWTVSQAALPSQHR